VLELTDRSLLVQNIPARITRTIDSNTVAIIVLRNHESYMRREKFFAEQEGGERCINDVHRSPVLDDQTFGASPENCPLFLNDMDNSELSCFFWGSLVNETSFFGRFRLNTRLTH
jgi:hypothetical protein